MFYPYFERALTFTCYKRSEGFLAVGINKGAASSLNTGTGSDDNNFSIRIKKKQGVIVRHSTGNDSYNPLYSYSGKSPL